MDDAMLELRKERARLFADQVAAESGLPVSSILGRSRDPEVVAARHRLWLRLYDSGLSMLTIARLMSVDHTSVIGALRKQLGPVVYAATVRQSSRKQRIA